MADQRIVIEFLEATHRRHLWPRRLKVHDGELLSSWIWRLADRQGVSPHNFLSLVPSGHLGAAMDQELTAAELSFLAARSANPFGALFNAMLLPPAGFLIADDVVNLHAALVRHGRLTLRTPGGRPVLQFCPSCLAAEPYFRKAWRFAHMVACPRHNRQLLDRCPACGGLIALFEQRNLGRQALCPRCGHDLTRAEAPNGTRLVKSQRRVAELLDFLINRGARTELIRTILTRVRSLPQALTGRSTPLPRLDVTARAAIFRGMTPQRLSRWLVGDGDQAVDRWHRLILHHGTVEVLGWMDPRRGGHHSATSAASSPPLAVGAPTADRAGARDSRPAASSFSISGKSLRSTRPKRSRKAGVVT